MKAQLPLLVPTGFTREQVDVLRGWRRSLPRLEYALEWLHRLPCGALLYEAGGNPKKISYCLPYLRTVVIRPDGSEVSKGSIDFYGWRHYGLEPWTMVEIPLPEESRP